MDHREDATVALQLLEKNLDDAISMASQDEWDRLEGEGESLLVLLERCRSIDFVSLARESEAASTSTTANHLSTILRKTATLADLIKPKHAELARELSGQVNTRKLSEAYRA